NVSQPFISTRMILFWGLYLELIILSRPSAASRVAGTSISVVSYTGNSMTIVLPAFKVFNSTFSQLKKLIVSRVVESKRIFEEASVACPHKGTSFFGVKKRML